MKHEPPLISARFVALLSNIMTASHLCSVCSTRKQRRVTAFTSTRI
jgi:hypothetical protein